MLYVATLTWHSHLGRQERQEGLARRANWELPEGIEPVAEYWVASSSPHVVVVFRADRYEPIMELAFTWNDVFDIAVAPATTAEEGLEAGPRVLERANAVLA